MVTCQEGQLAPPNVDMSDVVFESWLACDGACGLGVEIIQNALADCDVATSM